MAPARRTHRPARWLATSVGVLLASCVPGPKGEIEADRRSPVVRLEDRLDVASVLGDAPGGTLHPAPLHPAPVRPAAVQPAAVLAYEFDGDAGGWQGEPADGPAVEVGDGRARFAASDRGDGSFGVDVTSPPLDLDLYRYAEIEARLGSPGGGRVVLEWETGDPDRPEAAGIGGRLPMTREGETEVAVVRIPVSGMLRPPHTHLTRLTLRVLGAASPEGLVLDFVRLRRPDPGDPSRRAERSTFTLVGDTRVGLRLRGSSRLVFERGAVGAGVLRFGIGIPTPSRGTTFRVGISHEDGTTELFRRTLDRPDGWEDVRVEIPPEAEGGRLELAVEAPDPGDVGLWATPHWIADDAPAPAGPNVLVYVVDCLRYDALGVGGRSPSVTPAMDGLARSGASFDAAYSVTSWTRPAVASLMTSLYPDAHGVVVDQSVPDAAETLLEVARGEGYLTGVFSMQVHAGIKSNLGQGADFTLGPAAFVERVDRRTLGPPTSGALHGGFLRWLDHYGDAGRPFVAYLHSIDPHDPYWPSRERGREFVPDYPGPGGPEGRIGPDLPGDQAGRVRALYEAEVAANDAELALLLEALEARGLRSRTAVVLTADHGEEFYEHGHWGHMRSLKNVLLRIPLVVSLPGVVPEGWRGREPVSILDVAPTVLDLIGASPPDAFQGRSLVGAWAGGGGPGEARSIHASYHARRQTIIRDGWKYVERDATPLLYELDRDPGERRNRVRAEPERVERYGAELAAWRGEQARRRASFDGAGTTTPEVDVELHEALQALGYVEGPDGPAVHHDGALP